MEPCSYCLKPLAEESDEDTLPNLFVHDERQDVMLRLHGLCVQQVINGLTFGNKLLTN